ncbi:response regulator [Azonexus sp.]|uniref:response regulator n=1 Tax=Azonexus sp. TaxID=1872668 RepID=UPI0035AFBE7F
MKSVRIVLADDQLLVRAGIRALLETLPGYAVVAECANGAEVPAAIATEQPDVLLLDIAMPGPSGIEVAKTLRGHDNSLRILVLSSIERREIVEQALNAGVNGYLLKDFLLDELQEALMTVLADKPFLSPKIREIVQPHTGSDSERGERLTTRQIEILRLVAGGRTTKEIARQLEISPKTVEFHRARLMQRIGVHDVTGLTRFAIQNGLIY